MQPRNSKRISGKLSAARLGGGDENEEQMEKALAFLDSIAVSDLNIPAGPNLDGANRGLAELTSRTPPVGENYRLVKLGGTSAAYAMVINFGLGGPQPCEFTRAAPVTTRWLRRSIICAEGFFR